MNITWHRNDDDTAWVTEPIHDSFREDGTEHDVSEAYFIIAVPDLPRHPREWIVDFFQDGGTQMPVEGVGGGPALTTGGAMARGVEWVANQLAILNP